MNTVSERTFGIELEMYVPSGKLPAIESALVAAGVETRVESYNHTLRTHWKLTSDGSLTDAPNGYQGVELVSPVLKGETGLDTIRTVCAVLAGFNVKITPKCGFHVHHNARDLDLNAWKTMVKKYMTFEGVIDTFVPKSRRGNENVYCRSLRSRFSSMEAGLGALAQAKTFNEVLLAANGGNRYHKLNLTSFQRHGTVEFRQHSGTVEAEKIINWVIFGQAMIEDAVKTKFTRKVRDENQKVHTPMADLFWAVPAEQRKDLRSYYQGRAKALAA